LSEQKLPTLLTIAVIGGTGREGSGLARRWSHAGYRVIIGSRDAERAQQKADELNAEMGGTYLRGADNITAAQQANLIVISVPYEAHASTIEGLFDALQGKTIVDVTVPLDPTNRRVVSLPQGQSACLEAQELLGPSAKVVAAFQHIGSSHLVELSHAISCDVLICSDDEDAKNEVIQLARAAGLRGLDAGPLVNSIAIEAMGPVLLWLNKRYKTKGAGLVITGIDEG
jgi:8-hydroxy-5-deazaflavin:NADPH oxidoreductase